MDKNADGRITEEEVREVCVSKCSASRFLTKMSSNSPFDELLLQIIALSASANKLSRIQERVEEYTALIMEELDPNNLGYIEVCTSRNQHCRYPLSLSPLTVETLCKQLYNLEMLLLQPAVQPSAMLYANSNNLSQMLSQKLVPTKDKNPVRRCCRPRRASVAREPAMTPKATSSSTPAPSSTR